MFVMLIFNLLMCVVGVRKGYYKTTIKGGGGVFFFSWFDHSHFQGNPCRTTEKLQLISMFRTYYHHSISTYIMSMFIFVLIFISILASISIFISIHLHQHLLLNASLFQTLGSWGERKAGERKKRERTKAFSSFPRLIPPRFFSRSPFLVQSALLGWFRGLLFAKTIRCERHKV